MPVADRDEGPQRPAPVRRRVPPAGHPSGGDDRPGGPPRRPAPPAQQPIRRPPPAPTGDGTPPGPGSPEETASVTNFEDLTPLHPNARFVLETGGDELMGRVVDIVTPIGKGQRGLIVSPPRAGKTVLLQRMALSILKNSTDCYVIILLVDERPEEVTDMQRVVVGPNVEVVAST